MKSYTDIEQSEKLTEILSKDSADMSYSLDFDFEKYEVTITPYKNWVIPKYAQTYKGLSQAIPCWSLTALLNVLPVSCDDGQHCLALINHNPNDRTEWLCAYEDDKGNLMMECYADNQIDACVAMIEKLHEQNLL